MQRRWIWAIAILVASLVTLREMGVVDWSLYRCRSESNTSSGESTGSDLRGMRLFAYDDRIPLGPWKTMPVPGRPGYTIRYATGVTYPWSHWVPLVKWGEAKVQYVFYVTSDAGPIFCGLSADHTNLRVYGLSSARNFERMVNSDAFQRLCNTINNNLNQRQAAPVKGSTMPPREKAASPAI